MILVSQVSEEKTVQMDNQDNPVLKDTKVIVDSVVNQVLEELSALPVIQVKMALQENPVQLVIQDDQLTEKMVKLVNVVHEVQPVHQAKTVFQVFHLVVSQALLVNQVNAVPEVHKVQPAHQLPKELKVKTVFLANKVKPA